MSSASLSVARMSTAQTESRGRAGDVAAPIEFESVSVARHLHTPPQPRTEVDVAAAAIVAILDARIVPRTAGMIGGLSMATGVPVAEIKRAWELKESGHESQLPSRSPIAHDPTTKPRRLTANQQALVGAAVS